MKVKFGIAIVAVVGLLLGGLAIDASAQVPACNLAGAPACEGSCPPGDMCVDMGGNCACVPSTGPCEFASAPACDGDCPPGLACVTVGPDCICDIPTLSEWGIMIFAGLSLGFVFWHRRRVHG